MPQPPVLRYAARRRHTMAESKGQIEMGTRRFRVAFSFAGEKREFVAQIAEILAKTFGRERILYDKFHEAEFARHDLGILLPTLYGDESDLIVLVLCPSYDKKRWTGWEWLHIHGLLTKDDGRRVMPCRFEYATAEGLSHAAAFIELDGRDPTAIATLILERLALNEEKPRGHYVDVRTVSAPLLPLTITIPNNLPRIQSFFGRDTELAAIGEALSPAASRWGLLIEGSGGLGKTTLAVRAAYNIAPDQFERVIFVSAKDKELDDDGEHSFGNRLLAAGVEMWNEIARELSLSDFARIQEEQRSNHILIALRTSRTLLILDNLETLARSEQTQILRFVRRLPSGCKGVLTSRDPLGSIGERLVLLPLDTKASLDTLSDLAKHNALLAGTSQTKLADLSEKTGGNPLLLRWVAGQLGRGRCRTVDAALQVLCSRDDENDALAFVFGDVAEKLGDDERNVLVALSHFSTPTDPRHVATVAALSGGDVPPVLDALVNRSLAVADQQGRFGLVPMVGEFAKKQFPEIARDSAARLAQHAWAVVSDNGFSTFHRFGALEASWPLVAASLPIVLSGPNDALQRTCDGLLHFLDFSGRWDECLALSLKAESVAVASRDYARAARRALDATYVSWLRNDAKAVAAHSRRALSHCEHAGPSAIRERASATRYSGFEHEMVDDYASAIGCYRDALELARRASAKDVEANCVSDIGSAAMMLDDFGAAESHFNEALFYYRSLEDRDGIATAITNLSTLALNREDYEQAEKFGLEALEIADQLTRLELSAHNCCILATVMIERNQTEKALPYAQRAVEICRQIGSSDLAEAEALVRRATRAKVPPVKGGGTTKTTNRSPKRPTGSP